MEPLIPPRRYPHLELRRTERTAQRYTRIPPPSQRPDNSEHGARLSVAVEGALRQSAAQQPIPEIDPAMILRVKVAAPVQEATWRNAGFTVVGTGLHPHDQTTS